MRKTLTTAVLFFAVLAAYSQHEFIPAKKDTVRFTVEKLGLEKNIKRRELADTIRNLEYRIYHGLQEVDKLQCVSDFLFDSLLCTIKLHNLCNVVTQQLAESEIKTERVFNDIAKNSRRCDTLEKHIKQLRSLAVATLEPITDMYRPIWSDSKSLTDVKWELFSLIMPIDKDLYAMFGPGTTVLINVREHKKVKQYIYHF
jgi:hypothetical protein